MKDVSPIDQAYRRCEILSLLVERLRKDAEANPGQKRWQDFGIVEQADKYEDARLKILETFDEISNLLNHLFIVDMASSFEKHSKARLGTRIGIARSTLREARKKNSSIPEYYEKLINDLEHVDGIYAVAKFLNGFLATEQKDQLDEVREARNIFAHGTDIRAAPKISRDDARSILNEALNLI